MVKLGVTVWALCMWLDGTLVEHTYQKSMSECLKSKRTAMKIVRPERVQFACGEVNADIELIDGVGQTQERIRIIKINKHGYKEKYSDGYKG